MFSSTLPTVAQPDYSTYLAQARSFLDARRAQHGDFRMEADGDPAGDPPGGDPDPGQDPDPGGDPGDGQDPDADKLGDAGKQALDRMKGQLRTTKTELRAFKDLGLTPEQIRELTKPKADGDQPDPEKIREEARREARSEALRERVVDKIEARAAKKFADPEDAVAILLRSHKADDFLDGDAIDATEIDDALAELLTKKPHLAATPPRKFGGGGDQGPRDEGPKRAASLQDAVAARLNSKPNSR